MPQMFLMGLVSRCDGSESNANKANTSTITQSRFML